MAWNFRSPCRRVNGCNLAIIWASASSIFPFSPLVVGSMGATWREFELRSGAVRLSVPLSSGQWVQRKSPSVLHLSLSYLSVPLSSGQWVQQGSRTWPPHRRAGTFSPLVVGSMGATALAGSYVHPAYGAFQSPCRRVNGCNISRFSGSRGLESFQSPCRRVNGCNSHHAGLYIGGKQLSVPLSSGQWVQQPTHPLFLYRYFSFQSPCRRVNGCNRKPSCLYPGQLGLSVPLSSGQWVQRGGVFPPFAESTTFSPLVVGSMGATDRDGQ